MFNLSSIFTSNYDLVFCGIIFISAIIGLMRGLITEFLSCMIWVGAFLGANKFFHYLDSYIPHSISGHMIRVSIIFTFLLIALSIIASIVKRLLKFCMRYLDLGGIDFFLGGGFGVIRGIMICLAAVGVLRISQLDKNQGWDTSKIYQNFIKPVEISILLVPNDIPKH